MVDFLVVIINNDEQVELKGSVKFMDEGERLFIVNALKFVDLCLLSIDEDNTVCKSIGLIIKKVKKKGDTFCFLKGGDRLASEIPEKKICKKLGVEIIDGLGSKIQSSSSLIAKSKGLNT
jgi:bifunctional ADP-heptose synthase (sugar kinase/adenylyltransferase)